MYVCMLNLNGIDLYNSCNFSITLYSEVGFNYFLFIYFYLDDIFG